MLYWLYLGSNQFNSTIYQHNLLNNKNNTFDLLLGVVSATIAFPILVLAISLSVFLPQDKWEEFWDKFLEV